jgi:hypothetical protein
MHIKTNIMLSQYPSFHASAGLSVTLVSFEYIYRNNIDTLKKAYSSVWQIYSVTSLECNY